MAYSIFINCPWILNSKSYILNSISMLYQMIVHFLRRISMINRAEHKSSSLMVPNNMTSNRSFSCFKSPICKIAKSKSGCIIRGSLFRVPNPKGKMVWILYELPKARIWPNGGGCFTTYMIYLIYINNVHKGIKIFM